MEFNKLHQLFIDLNGTRMISSVFEGSTNKLTENLGSISKYLKVDKCKNDFEDETDLQDDGVNKYIGFWKTIDNVSGFF